MSDATPHESPTAASSAGAPADAAAAAAAAATEGHPDHHHNPYLAHHFETQEQQIESGKLGMWLFLATEILLFGGLFCFYAVYRATHPEVFEYAHQYLDKNLGAINTVILLFSSLTMAWAVRAAQLGQQKTLVFMLLVTFLCGCGFMGIKAIEYGKKFKESHVPGPAYYAKAPDKAHATTDADATPADVAPPAAVGGGEAPAAPALPDTVPSTVHRVPNIAPGASEVVVERKPEKHATPHNPHLFFGIYFALTGLHGIHVLIGMIVLVWLMVRALRGHFGPKYNEPVDIGGLYWHLVDLIWIFLFPLLYLVD